MPLPKPDEAVPAGALTHLTGDGADKVAATLGKIGWQSHWPHSGPKADQRDYFEYSLPARLDLSACNPALVLDLPAAADAGTVKAAAAAFGEARLPVRPPSSSARPARAAATAAPTTARALRMTATRCGSARYAFAPLSRGAGHRNRSPSTAEAPARTRRR